MSHRWWRALWRAILATLIVFTLAHIPLPAMTPPWLALALPPLLIFILICYMGKLLLDTLFFDRYH